MQSSAAPKVTNKNLVEQLLNQAQLDHIERMSKIPIVQLCMNLLIESIVLPGIMMDFKATTEFSDTVGSYSETNKKTKRRKVAMSELFKYVVDNYWLTFCRDLMLHIYKFGFSPYTVIRKSVKFNGQTISVLIPIVPPMHLFSIYYIETTKYEKEIIFYRNHIGGGATAIQSKPETKIKCFIDSYPDCNGMCVSKIASLIDRYLFVEHIMQFTLQMEYNRAAPTIYAQTMYKSDNDRFELDVAVESELLDHQDQIQFIKEKNKINHLNAMKHMSKVLSDKRKQRLNNADGTMRYQYDEIHDNMFSLPENVQLSTTQPALQAPGNMLVQYIDLFQHEVCMTFKIPGKLVMENGRGGGGGIVNERSNNHVEVNMISRTLDSTQKLLVGFLNQLYFEMYGTNDANISFNAMKIIDVDTVLMMLQEGLLDQDAIKDVVRASGLDVSHYNPENFQKKQTLDLDLVKATIDEKKAAAKARVRPAS